MKKLVIFDLDGTLFYTIEDIAACLNLILSKYGYNTLTSEETRKLVGYGARNLVKSATNESGEKLDKLYSEYVELQRVCDNSKTYLYRGMGEVLKYLKYSRVKLAVVSNKPDAVTKELCNQKLLEYKFDYIAGANPELYPIKPDKACIEYCLNVLNVDKRDAVYVGDSEVDVATAKNAEIECISVLWGYRDKEQIERGGGYNFVSNAAELLNAIEKI